MYLNLKLTIVACLSIAQAVLLAVPASYCQDKSDNALLQKAMNLRKERKYEEALEVYKQLCEQSPYNSIAFQEKGAVLASLNKYKEAITAENRAIRLNPTLHLAHIYKGMIYCNKKRNLDAHNEFSKALKLKPQSYVVHMRLGLVSNQLKRLDEAEKMYRKASKLKPKRSAPHLALSSVYVKQGKVGLAVDEAKQAIKLEPNAINYNNLGAIYAIVNKLEEAEGLLSKAIALNPKFTDAYITLGRVQTLKGEYQKATQNYQMARELSPRNRVAFNALEQLKNKSIYRIKVVDSKTGWHVTKYGYKPKISVTLKNMSGVDLSNKWIYLKARVENLKKGSTASAQTKVKQEFKPDSTIKVEMKSRAKFNLASENGNATDFQCTVNARVGNVSSYDSQYILDRLMEKPVVEEPDKMPESEDKKAEGIESDSQIQKSAKSD